MNVISTVASIRNSTAEVFYKRAVRAYKRAVQEIHRTRARKLLGPGRVKVYTLSFSINKAKITGVTQLLE